MDQGTRFVLIALASVLVVVTVVSFWLFRKGRSEKQRIIGENLLARARAWWSMSAVFVVTLYVGGVLSLIVWIGVSFLAFREYIKSTPLKDGDKRTLLWIYLIVLPFHYWLIWMEWYALFSIFIPVYAFILVPLRSVLADDYENFLERTAKIQWGLMVCVYFLSHAPALYMLEIDGFAGKNGNLLFFLFVVVELGDVTGYLIGQLKGSRKLLPQIRPETTVLGALGGITCATVVGSAFCWMTPFAFAEAAGLAVLLALMGIGGDLTMSAIKRDSGYESSSSLIEGGILDRIDSLCFAVPIFFHLTRYFYVL